MTQPITTAEPTEQDGTARCTEAGCTTTVADTPDNRCGGSVDGGPQGCGRLFCGGHLYATYQYGHLCGDDYNNVDDREPGTADEPVDEVGDVGKCPNCGRQSRSYSRGCSNCGHGKPTTAEPVEPPVAGRGDVFAVIVSAVSAGLPVPARLNIYQRVNSVAIFVGDDLAEAVDRWAEHLGLPAPAMAGHRNETNRCVFDSYRSEVRGYPALPGWSVEVVSYITLPADEAEAVTR